MGVWTVKVRGEAWEKWAKRRGDPAAGPAMWIARRRTGLTLRETGEGIGDRDYAAAPPNLQCLLPAVNVVYAAQSGGGSNRSGRSGIEDAIRTAKMTG